MLQLWKDAIVLSRLFDKARAMSTFIAPGAGPTTATSDLLDRALPGSKNNNGLAVVDAADSVYIFPSTSTCYTHPEGVAAAAAKDPAQRRKKGGSSLRITCEPGTLECLSTFRPLLTEDGYIHECRRCFCKVRAF